MIQTQEGTAVKKEPFKDFESAMAVLEAKVKALEDGSLPLEDAIRVFEEGMGASRFCARKLEEAEQRVEILVREPDGTLRKEPFCPEDTDRGPASGG